MKYLTEHMQNIFTASCSQFRIFAELFYIFLFTKYLKCSMYFILVAHFCSDIIFQVQLPHVVAALEDSTEVENHPTSVT